MFLSFDIMTLLPERRPPRQGQKPNENKISRRWRKRALLSFHPLIETPSLTSLSRRFPRGFTFYVAHPNSLHSSFSLYAGQRVAASSGLRLSDVSHFEFEATQQFR
jgi:hypothetical protein